MRFCIVLLFVSMSAWHAAAELNYINNVDDRIAEKEIELTPSLLLFRSFEPSPCDDYLGSSKTIDARSPTTSLSEHQILSALQMVAVQKKKEQIDSQKVENEADTGMSLALEKYNKLLNTHMWPKSLKERSSQLELLFGQYLAGLHKASTARKQVWEKGWLLEKMAMLNKEMYVRVMHNALPLPRSKTLRDAPAFRGRPWFHERRPFHALRDFPPLKLQSPSPVSSDRAKDSPRKGRSGPDRDGKSSPKTIRGIEREGSGKGKTQKKARGSLSTAGAKRLSKMGALSEQTTLPYKKNAGLGQKKAPWRLR